MIFAGLGHLPVSASTSFWLAVVGLALTCAAAIAADSFAEFSRKDLEELCKRRNAPDRLGRVLRGHRHAALAAETLQAVSTALFVGAIMVWLWRQLPADEPVSWKSVLAALALGALALLALEIWIPWAVARLWATPIVYFSWPLWRLIGLLLYPLLWEARVVEAFLERLSGRVPEQPDEESFGEEIRTIVSEGHREGLLEEEAREMIEGVIQLGAVDVSQVMTPRTDMVSLPISKSWEELIEFAVQVEHTRIPVYNKNRDDIVGLLYTKDLLPELAKPPAERVQPWTKLLREPYFVPETKPVDVLLQEFQRSRQHLAVVLDEYGGVSGLVSLEDVLEEIVGEIGDEYDEEEVPELREIDGGALEALGRVRIDDINQHWGCELPEDSDFDTIGGLVFSELGHIPVVGEQVTCQGVRVTVLEASNRRIERVRLERVETERMKAEG